MKEEEEEDKPQYYSVRFDDHIFQGKRDN